MPDVNLYLDELVQKLGAKQDGSARLKLRTLLRQFGYERRHQQAVDHIHHSLQSHGLVVDFSVSEPKQLDEWVVIRLLASEQSSFNIPEFKQTGQVEPSVRNTCSDNTRERTDPGIIQSMTAVPGQSASGKDPSNHQENGVSASAAGTSESSEVIAPSPTQRNPTASSTITMIESATTAILPPITSEPPADRRDISDIAEKGIASTVQIFSGDNVGGGFLVHSQGLVVTARHVVEEGNQSNRRIRVVISDGKEVKGVVFRSHRTLDFALIWLDQSASYPSLSLGDPQKLRFAEPLLAIGHPGSFRNTVSRGIVSNPRAIFNKVECLQTDAAIDHGNSGGPMLNEAGEVVGVNVWGWGNMDNAKFAVPIDYFKDEIELAIKYGFAHCVEAPYCPLCGYLHYEGAEWYCKACGAQKLVKGFK